MSQSGKSDFSGTPFVNPNKIVFFSDDFLSGSGTGWTKNLNPSTLTFAGHPGTLGNLVMGPLDEAFIVLALNTSSINLGTQTLGAGTLNFHWIFYLASASDGTNRYIIRLGLGDTVNAGTDVVNGVYFEYSDNINTGKWVIKTASASTRTTTNSTTTFATGWHHAQASVNAAGTSVTYIMDGVTLGTIATNIPTTPISPFIDLTLSLGALGADTMLADLYYETYTLTTAR